jgi:hypothetical protein
VEGEVVQALNPLDTLTVVEVPVDLSCMMVHILELEPVKLVLDMVDRTVDRRLVADTMEVPPLSQHRVE